MKQKSNCATCSAKFRPVRADAKYCSDACRQRAHRLRTDGFNVLMQDIDATRRHYWTLVAQLGTALRSRQAKAISELLSQHVDKEGYVYIGGRLVGRAEPTRPGWDSWGDEAAGPPFCQPSKTWEPTEDELESWAKKFLEYRKRNRRRQEP